ncbi:PTS transporter subunit EIIC [Paenibacillus kandeliae]|uniref:PTS transporter subunit EIIC n=1 Tax=Paenibacillus kandeliae TaxID=3231269 RepID=UPI003459BDA2
MRQEDRHSPAAKRRERSRHMQELATQLIEQSGGLPNVQEVLHCTTRIRLRLHRPELANHSALAEIPEVHNVCQVGTQLQMIVGPELTFRLHRQIERQMQHMSDPLLAGGTQTNIQNEQNEAQQTIQQPNMLEQTEQMGQTPLRHPQRMAEQLLSASDEPFVTEQSPFASIATSDQTIEKSPSARRSLTTRIVDAVSFFSDIIVPMIPIFVAAGILLGLVSLLQFLGWASVDTLWFRLLQLLTGSIFQIISVMFGYYAAKRFGGTPVLGAVLGMLMSRPEIVGSNGMPPSVISSFGLVALPQFSYQGTAIPVIVAAMLMAMLEIRLRRVIPNSVHVLVIPVLSLLGGSILALFVIGPLSGWLGHWCAALLKHLYAYGGTWFGLVLGGAYSSIVLTGLHQSLQAIEAGLISNPDIAVNFLLPIWSMANVAQGGAGLAVYLRTRDSMLRKAALPGALIAFLGITEPVALGVNLKLVRPFIAAAAGGAVGGAYIGWHHVVASSFGLTGIPMLAFIIPFGWSNFIHYMTGFVLATGTAFVLTLLLGRSGHSS